MQIPTTTILFEYQKNERSGSMNTSSSNKQLPAETSTEDGVDFDPEPETSPSPKPGTALVVTTPDTVNSVHSQQSGLISKILGLFGLRPAGTLRDDLENALSGTRGDESEVFSPEERAMLNNILRLREVRVEDVMVPRADIIAVDNDITLDELLLLFEASGHSRFPVFCDTMDDPRGMVMIKDLQAYIVRTASRQQKPAVKNGKQRPGKLDLSKIVLSKKLGALKLVRKVLFVPPSMLVTELMTRMQTARTQMALVIDEYGGTDGLVSLEDIVEEVFGEIEDEHDDDDGPMIEKTAEGVYIADARTELDEVAAMIGAEFQYGELGEDMDTIGGLVFSLVGRIPVRGEVIDGIAGFEFRILDADPRRIRRLQIVQRRSSARVQRGKKQASSEKD